MREGVEFLRRYGLCASDWESSNSVGCRRQCRTPSITPRPLRFCSRRVHLSFSTLFVINFEVLTTNPLATVGIAFLACFQKPTTAEAGDNRYLCVARSRRLLFATLVSCDRRSSTVQCWCSTAQVIAGVVSTKQLKL